MFLKPGQLIGAYEILEPLGEGGMGEVYRARDNRLGRLVAIKIVSAGLHADVDATNRLQREARLASSLNHPAIVTVYDIGELDGRPFIVMELVDGQALSSRLAAGPMHMREASEIASQVADGLAAAHGAGVVHRDLKPQNIMLTADHRAKIVDFGLSKMVRGPRGPDAETAMQPDLTDAHTIVGSAGYMAPEQVSGHTVTFRADQFALGVVLYEMLTGRRAFKRDTSIQTMAAVVGEEPTPILEICPSIPPSLVTIIERCLAKHPEHRYDSTRDLARDLRDARDLITSSRGSRPAVRFPVRRRFWKTAAALTLVLAVIAAATYSQWKTARSAAVAGTTSFRQVVVLPFACPSANSRDQVFCDGLVETLTIGLSGLQRFDRTLRVVSQAVSQRDMPKDNVSADSARRTLGATLALTGAMERNAAAMRVTLRRVDSAGGPSRSIDIAAGQEATMQDALTTAAAALLDVDLGPASRVAIGAGGTAVPGAYESYVLGRGYLRRLAGENLDLAIVALTGAVSADTRYALAHAALCEAYWRKYERQKDAALIDRARVSCRTALQIDERLATVHVTLAMIARGQQRYEEAIESAKHAVSLDPASSEASHELGAAYEADNQWSGAEAAYTTAIQARPDDTQMHSDVCRFYALRGLWAEAESRCRHALQLTPDSTRVLNNLGAALLKLQRSEEAAAKFQRSLEIRPTSAAASNLGYYGYSQGRYAEAARAYEKAAGLNPGDREVWRSLGAALYWAPGERSKARAAYEEVVRLTEQARSANPRDARLLGQLADAYSLLGRTREAREALDALERLKPDNSEVLFLVAGVYEQLGGRAQAFTWLERAIAAGYSRDQVDRSPFLTELRKDHGYARLVK